MIALYLMDFSNTAPYRLVVRWVIVVLEGTDVSLTCCHVLNRGRGETEQR